MSTHTQVSDNSSQEGKGKEGNGIGKERNENRETRIVFDDKIKINALEVAVALCSESRITGIEERHELSKHLILEVPSGDDEAMMKAGKKIMDAWMEHKKGKFTKQFRKWLGDGLYKEKPKPKEVNPADIVRQQILEDGGDISQL